MKDTQMNLFHAFVVADLCALREAGQSVDSTDVMSLLVTALPGEWDLSGLRLDAVYVQHTLTGDNLLEIRDRCLECSNHDWSMWYRHGSMEEPPKLFNDNLNWDSLIQAVDRRLPACAA